MRGFAQAAGLAVSMAVTFSAALIGSSFPVDEWYAGLAKPSWNPPGWVFGPVWIVLYILMAAAAWLVWRKAGFRGAALPLLLYLLQLVLNAAWSWFFFDEHRIGMALADIVALLALIVIVALLFRRILPLAGWFMVPYISWVAFAALLNFTLWKLNG
ncbi:tryptophan-rich sensory protein [Candidatus Fermentibacteria bacterium]|nr:tryptophan-rich sensory protein [Candidatus Fermentibacteria bacterium]